MLVVGHRHAQHLVERVLHAVGVLAVLHQRAERAGGRLEVELGGAEVVQGPRPVEGLGDARRLEQVARRAAAARRRRPAGPAPRTTSGARERTICDLALEAGVVDPVVEAAPLERVVQLAGAVGGEDDDRRRRGLDRAELGDAHLPGREHLEQERLELVVGPVDLVDQQHAPGSAGARPAPAARAGTARRTGSSRPPRGRLPPPPPRARAGAGSGAGSPSRRAPGWRRCPRSTAAGPAAGRGLGERLGQRGLAGAGLALEQQRALHRERRKMTVASSSSHR